MRGRKRTRPWPSPQTDDALPHAHDVAIDADGQTDAALLALVRLLARQAAREVFEQSVTDPDRYFDEGRE
jgi:hypothetical protein